MSETANSDVIVIGGGIAGMSAAWRIAAAGARVVLLEAESQPGYHSSGRSAATFTEAYGNAAIRRVTQHSRDFLETPPSGFASVPLLRPRGTLTLGDATQEPLIEEELARSPGVLQRVDTAEALRLVPVLRPHAAAFALYEANCRDIDVDALLGGYRRGLLGAGGRIVLDTRAERITREGGSWVVQTPAGRFAADKVVNAAGAWAEHVASLAGAQPVGLQPKRRTAVLIEAPGSTGWPMVTQITETLYFKPDAGRLMVSPADTTPSEALDAQPDELDIAIAMDRLHQATTLDIRRVHHRWAGLRTFAPDHTPVLGEEPDLPGFIWLAGQGGYGVMTSPALSALAASCVAGQPVPDDLSVARFR